MKLTNRLFLSAVAALVLGPLEVAEADSVRKTDKLIMKKNFLGRFPHAFCIPFFLLFALYSAYAFGVDIYYVASDSIGVLESQKPSSTKGITEMSECIGAFSDTPEGLLKECYARAKDTHVEDGIYSFYNRVWRKRDIAYGWAKAAWLYIPYHLVNVRDGSHSTYYSYGVSYRTMSCEESCFALVVEPDSLPPQHCEGNPVEVTAGDKYQKEVDFFSPFEFSRHYRYSTDSNTLGSSWNHTFDRKLKLLDSSVSLVLNSAASPMSQLSPPFASAEEACVSGWNDMRGRMKGAWAKNAVASYSDGICNIHLDDQSLKMQASVVNLMQLLESGAISQEVSTRTVAISRPNGAHFVFAQSATGWEPMRGTTGQLSQLEEGSWKFTDGDGRIEIYSSDGALEYMRSAQGREYNFTYDVRRFLTSVESRGSRLSLKYEKNTLSGIVLNGRPQVQFAYNDNGMLKSVSYADGGGRGYYYENENYPRRLTGVTDEKGVREATWTYDGNGRVIVSAGNGGTNRHTFEYGDTKTTVTNPRGKRTTFHYEIVTGGRRIASVEGHASEHCSAANRAYEYSSNGYLESRTDWSGNITRYIHDEYGREVSRTEAFGTSAGRAISTEYHPELSLPVKISEPEKVTEMEYDSSGRLISRTVRAKVD